MRLIKIFSCLLLISFSTNAQQIRLLESGRKTSIRGLSVVSNTVFWASGSNGTVARSTDGGKTIQWITVPGYEKRDFRDIEALDAQTALIMAVAEPAVILKTTDGGQHWRKVFEDSTKGMFLDAMDMLVDTAGLRLDSMAAKSGIAVSDIDPKNASAVPVETHYTLTVVGDPINGKMFAAVSFNSGETWSKFPSDIRLDTGEAFFAASGSNIKMLHPRDDDPKFFVVSGGTKSALIELFTGIRHPLPQLLQGKESTGANGIDIHPVMDQAVIVGGDFAKDSISSGNCVLVSGFRSGKLIFKEPQTPPHGYRSGVAYLSKLMLVACGTSGVDISRDGGRNWQLLSKEGFHVVKQARQGKAVFLAGGNGRIAKLEEE